MVRRKRKIRKRILAAFFIMLIFSFSLIGIIFNIAADRYIENNAVMQIDETYKSMVTAIEQAETYITELPEESENMMTNTPVRGNTFRIASNMFIVDAGYNLLDNQNVLNEMSEIIHTLEYNNINLNRLRNRQVVTDEGSVYYVSAYSMSNSPLTDENVYWIIYADVTGLFRFSSSINFFLIILVYITFSAAIIVTFFLSNSITGPIQKLAALASSIGRGDFTVKDFKFKDSEFDALNMVLNKSAKKLSKYDRQQKAFFQNVSHELRTPLMSIKCYAEGISFGVMEPKQASETILEETDKLTELVKDILYISKIDNITTIYTTVQIDLTEIIHSCARGQKAVADKRQIHFSYDFSEEPIYFDCVTELITRAVDNLISNAIRYASSEIILSCLKQTDKISISVKDDGNGIDNESLPHIFERFYKGAGGNYGIGLSIVKSIVEQHGGIVTAENTPESGAVFTITLPYKIRRK